jgi:hypothetical protein
MFLTSFFFSLFLSCGNEVKNLKKKKQKNALRRDDSEPNARAVRQTRLDFGEEEEERFFYSRVVVLCLLK